MRPRPTFDVTRPAVERLLDSTVTSYDAVEEGGYSPTSRWLVTLVGGRSAFVKAELEGSDDHGLSLEHLVYSSVSARSIPALLGYAAGDDSTPRVLVTEDLSGARWGTPLDEADALALGRALDELHDVRPPDGVPAVDLPAGWATFAADPAPLVATGLLDEDWAVRWLPDLVAAAASIDTKGDRLLHCDLWLQNWCRADRGVVLVDWAGAQVGNPMLMRAFGEGAVRAAGGPAGHVLRGEPGWAAWMAGITAEYLTEPHEGWPPRLLETERREALACLRWACGELDLPEPRPDPVFRALGPWRP